MTSNYDNYRKQVRAILEDGGSITSKEAIDLLGCTRLSAVIFALKKEYGLNIVSHIEWGENRNGHRVGFSRYYLEEFKDRYE